MNVSHLPAPQARAARLGLPYRAHFVLTHKCNMACEHCYQAEHDSEDLSLEEVKRVLSELAELGAFELVLGGGEPLARRDFWEILEEARRLRFAVTLYTNGTLLDEAKVRRLASLGVTKVSLSLHGAESTTHDAFVRRPGAFDRINRAVDLLEAQGLAVTVKTSVTKANVRQMPALGERFGRRPLTVLSLNTTIFPRDDGDPSSMLWRIDESAEREMVRAKVDRMPRAEFERVLSRAAEIQAVGERERAPCEAARTWLAIHPNGDVSPCVQSVTQVMGNVRRRSLKEIWRDSSVGSTFRELRPEDFDASHSECGRCPFRKVCSRCAAMSLSLTGSLTGHSDQHCRSTKLYWSEVRRRAAELELPCPV